MTPLTLVLCAALLAAAFWLSGALMTLVGASLMLRVESPLAARTVGRQLLGGAYIWMHSMTAVLAGFAASLAALAAVGPLSPAVVIIAVWAGVFVWLLTIGGVALLPELGVWRWLQRTDVMISVVAGGLLAAYALTFARNPFPVGLQFTQVAIAGIAALLIGFELGARASCLGAVTRFDSIASRGSDPELEATLRHSVRRIKPFVLAAAALLIIGLAALLSHYLGRA